MLNFTNFYDISYKNNIIKTELDASKKLLEIKMNECDRALFQRNQAVAELQQHKIQVFMASGWCYIYRVVDKKTFCIFLK